MKKQRIKERLTALEVGQSCEFTTSVYTKVSQPPVSPDPSGLAMLRSINDVLTGENNPNEDGEEHEHGESRALANLADAVVEVEREVQDEYRPQRTHFAAVGVRRSFDRSMGEAARGVFSVLSITVYRSR